MKDKKSKKYFYGFCVGASVAYLTSLLLKAEYPHGDVVFGIFNTLIQISLDAISVIILWRLRSSQHFDRTVRLIFFLALISELVADAIYGLEVNIIGISNIGNSWLELSYNVPYLLFLYLSAWGFVKQASHASINYKVLAASSTVTITMAIICIFASKIFGSNLTHLAQLTHLSGFLAEGVIVGYGLLYVLFSVSNGLRILSSGYLVIVACSLVLECVEFLNGLQMGLPIELIWSFGQMVIVYGFYFISQEANPDTSPDERVWDANSVVSRLVVQGLVLSMVLLSSWYGLKFFWPNPHLLPPLGILTAWLLIILVALCGYGLAMRSALILPLKQTLTSLKHIHQTNETGDVHLPQTTLSEFKQIGEEIVRIFQTANDQRIKSDKLSRLAIQVSHDIRSPLAALRTVTSESDDLPAASRQLIIQITSRIQMIADNLLSKQSMTAGTPSPMQRSCMIYPVIESVVSEKRLLTNNHEVTIDVDAKLGSHLTILALPADIIGRILSNLLNNSLEAYNTPFEPKKAGSIKSKIIISLMTLEPQKVRLQIADEAGGIDEDIMEKIILGNRATSKASGFGLGLHHAREMVSLAGGSLRVDSIKGHGTTVTMDLPKLQAPMGLTEQIEMAPNKKIVVLDDDGAMGAVWKSKFPKFLEIINFTSIVEFLQAPLDVSQCVLLVDFELTKDSMSGIDFLERSRFFNKQTYVVTSHHDDTRLYNAVQRLGCKLIPKFAIPFVKIKLAANKHDIWAQGPGL